MAKIDVDDHIGGPPAMVRISELVRELHHNPLCDLPSEAPRRSQKQGMLAIFTRDQELLRALQSGELISYRRITATGSIDPIDKSYWLRSKNALPSNDIFYDIYEINSMGAIPDNYEVLLRVEDANEWLIKNGISARFDGGKHTDDPARRIITNQSDPPRKPTRKPASRDYPIKNAVIEEGIRILVENEGNISQSNLRRMLADFAEKSQLFIEAKYSTFYRYAKQSKSYYEDMQG